MSERGDKSDHGRQRKCESMTTEEKVEEEEYGE